MQTYSKKITHIADRIVSNRLGNRWGTHTFSAYLNLLNARTTAHLNEAMRKKVKRTTGEQRRRALLSLEGTELVIHIPVNDIRTGQTLRASLEFSVWLNLMEAGADTAWRLRYKKRASRCAQISCNASCMRGTTVAISRVILAAGAGDRVLSVDGNPLNLRRSNLRLNASVAKGVKRSRRNDLKIVKHATVYRAKRAGAELGPSLFRP